MVNTIALIIVKYKLKLGGLVWGFYIVLSRRALQLWRPFHYEGVIKQDTVSLEVLGPECWSERAAEELS